MTIHLEGLALQFFRGIGNVRQDLGPFKDFNIFIGANNSGKSTVLDFIHRYLGRNIQSPDPLDQYRGSPSGNLSFSIGVSLDNFIANASKLCNPRFNEQQLRVICEALARANFIWLSTDPLQPNRSVDYSHTPNPKLLVDIFGRQREWYEIWSSLIGSSGGSVVEHWIPQTLNKILQATVVKIPQVKLIPAIRQIGSKGEEFSAFDGRGLIDRLAEIQSPDHDRRQERKIFDNINLFLQSVTGKDAVIEIPHSRQHILVHIDNRVLPLHALGTGIHEVIMIAAFCTLTEESIVCIEEPELHLHPLLQRKLIGYLNQKTSNQYFIATHSAGFIDTLGAAIFHVSNDGIQTTIRESLLRGERAAICADLGYRASDILQSNAIIWVEGPSDRIYVGHWLRSIDPELVEGIHYSIMFYGGRLLSHLSADESLVEGFIDLRGLNSNLAIIIDSDMSSESEKINSTKQRLVEEFSSSTGVAWVTKGREIENYIEHGMLQAAVKITHPDIYGRPANTGGQFEHALQFYRENDKLHTSIKKVEVARLVVASETNFDMLDLRERCQELVSFIRKANGLSQK